MTRLAKLSSKNQLTVPRALLKAYPDVRYFDISVAEGGILLKPVRPQAAVSAQAAVQAHLKRLGVGPSELRKALRWARERGETR